MPLSYNTIFTGRMGRLLEIGVALRKIIFITAGTIAVALGLIGIFVPVLPTTPFLLLAAACYAASSQKFYRWLTANRLFGSYLKDYREGKGVPFRVKTVTLLLMWATMAISILLYVDSLFARAIMIAIAIAVTAHVLLIKTKNTEKN